MHLPARKFARPTGRVAPIRTRSKTTAEAIDYQTGLNSAWSNIVTFVPKFVVFLLVLVIGYFVAKAVSKILAKICRGSVSTTWSSRAG